jgi:hypothetical protein
MNVRREAARAGDGVGSSSILVWNGVVTRIRRIGVAQPKGRPDAGRTLDSEARTSPPRTRKRDPPIA